VFPRLRLSALNNQLSTLNFPFLLPNFLPLFSPEKVWDTLPDKVVDRRYNFAVSASEIIKELPKLSEAERRAIREGLLEIANQDTDLVLCNQTALDGALILDRMENEYT
jgi:hypothetical protein